MIDRMKIGMVAGLICITLSSIGCGGKQDDSSAAQNTSGTPAPPPGVAEQIKNDPNMTPEQKAKYLGTGAASTTGGK